MLFFGTLHSDAYIFPFVLCFSLLFTAICKASPDSHFAFLHFFSMGMVLIPVGPLKARTEFVSFFSSPNPQHRICYLADTGPGHACMRAKCFSHVQLFVTLWTEAHQAPLSKRFSRQECCSGLPCRPPGDLPDPGIKPMSFMSPVLAGEFFTTWEAQGQDTWAQISPVWTSDKLFNLSVPWFPHP